MKTGVMAAGIALLCVTGLAFASFAGTAADSDGDGVFNVLDNCSALANGGACGAGPWPCAGFTGDSSW